MVCFCLWAPPPHRRRHHRNHNGQHQKHLYSPPCILVSNGKYWPYFNYVHGASLGTFIGGLKFINAGHVIFDCTNSLFWLFFSACFGDNWSDQKKDNWLCERGIIALNSPFILVFVVDLYSWRYLLVSMSAWCVCVCGSMTTVLFPNEECQVNPNKPKG